MANTERAMLARNWWQVLTTTGRVPISERYGQSLLAKLLGDFAAGVDADRFDPSVGARVGAALAAAGLTDPAVPAVSASVLHQLVKQSDQVEYGRLAAMLAELGRGYDAERRLTANVDGEGSVQDRFRIFFDHAAVAIAVGDTNGMLLDANRCLADMIGVDRESLRGISVYDFAHPDDRPSIRALVYDRLVAAGGGTVKLERRMVRSDGSVGWGAFTITYVKGAGSDSDYLLAIGEDVTEQHMLRDELHWQARHDVLTSLPNRRLLLEHIEEVITNTDVESRVGLCFVDLDRFKFVNDRYGHGIGDQVLVIVASRLNAVAHANDCLIARLGGDEFVVLVPPPTDDDRVTMISDSLLAALSKPIVVGEHGLRLTASIGTVVTPVVGAQADALIDAADARLYHAKNKRRPYGR